MNCTNLTIALLSVIVVPAVVKSEHDCPRRESKIVRKLIQKWIQPVYTEHHVVFPHGCQLAPPRDVYGHQENAKYEETPTKWVCNVCGKSFYEERFLDKHLDNRHPDTIRPKQGTVCLADLCPLFRCEVIVPPKVEMNRYWDHALCREEDLMRQHADCLTVIQACVPKDTTPQIQKIIFTHLNSSLCAYLTCENYWELPEREMSPLSLVYYIVAGMILVMGLCTYYLLLQSQLAQQQPSTSHPNGADREKNTNVLYAPGNQEIRYRSHVPPT